MPKYMIFVITYLICQIMLGAREQSGTTWN